MTDFFIIFVQFAHIQAGVKVINDTWPRVSYIYICEKEIIIQCIKDTKKKIIAFSRDMYDNRCHNTSRKSLTLRCRNTENKQNRAAVATTACG